GVALDPTRAIVPNVEVALNELFHTPTDKSGWYPFPPVPQGLHRLRFEMAGFQRSMVDRVPVQRDHVTRVDTVLNLGSVAETISVQAALPMLQTESASVSVSQPAISTPRVREYFPETLYWNPELITGLDGRASINVKLGHRLHHRRPHRRNQRRRSRFPATSSGTRRPSHTHHRR
ncbi:MAG: carboxypeptidase-like regulatory domain-containing protein, partial [Acidobacteria bacterium]|nr:carboxypeptidase-like regulatory domain-containing protein [Acidobacteriota bacterium]